MLKQHHRIWKKGLISNIIIVILFFMFALRAPCAKYNMEVEKYNKEVWANFTQEENAQIAYMSEHMGAEITKLSQIFIAYTTLHIEERLKLKFQKWIETIHPEVITELAKKSYNTWVRTKEMLQIRTGALFKDIINKIKQKSEGQMNEKLFIYSGHGHNIRDLWAILDLNPNDIFLPDFASILVFELHKSTDTKDFYVTMYYANNPETIEPHRVIIPGCSNPCPLQEFDKITQHISSVDYEKMCKI